MRTASALVALVLLVAPTAAADPVNLKWSLKEGDSFYATTTQEIDQAIKVMGQTVNQKMTTTTVAKFEAKAVKGGGFEVKMTYTKMTMDGALGNGGGLTDRFKGASLTATFDKGFELKKLEGYDKFLDQLSDGDDGMKKIFRAVMPETAVKLMFSQVFVGSPKEKAAVGDKWSRTDKVPLSGLGELTNKTQFTLDGVSGDVATLKTTGDVTFKTGEGGDALPFKVVSADIKSDEVKGTILFDLKAGRLKSSSTSMKLKGTMTIEVMNQQVDAEIDQNATTKVELSDKNPVRD
ncbi:DUF6263 family protein [Gemmata sp. JC717]|uniref:DUF6263 family protein n=1 Tax=Gemmata algarum TaxID=2975278 RepID=UPI0021BA5B93|nr:DUF6263 family protein [Gemmata algarum]MDY3555890.1 DUF6263 family protein [Gemmata algarum]